MPKNEVQQSGYNIPPIDELGMDLMLEHREFFEEISQMNQSLPFGWAFAEDNFNVDYEAAQIKEPITKPGDIWQLGRHRLMCGDAIDVGAVANLMDGKKARMIFTDPLWNVVYGSRRHPSREQQHIFTNKMSTEDFYKTLLAALKAMVSVSEPGTPTYIVTNAKEMAAFMSAPEEAGYKWSSTIIWGKDSHILRCKDYHEKYEPIWYGWLEGEKRLCPLQDRQQSDYWHFDHSVTSELHSAMKPIALAARAINNSSRDGDAVLDLFGGFGTTLIACEQTRRVGYIMELDCVYCDVIVKRYISQVKSDADVFLLRDGN